MPGIKVPPKSAFIFLSVVMCLFIWQWTMIGPFLISGKFKSKDMSKIEDYTPFAYPIHKLSPYDYSKLINITDFKFQMLSGCIDNIMLIIVVFTSSANFQQRKSIRDTWGRKATDVKIVFVLGSASNPKLQDKLEQEHDKYHDLIQGKFSENFTYKSYKYVTTFKYVIYYCTTARYLVTVDDDVFVNVPEMLKFVRSYSTSFSSKKMVMCTSVKDAPNAVRQKDEDEKNEKSAFYPPHCAEWSLIYSPEVVFILYRELQALKHYWIDDLLTTGILAKRKDIPCVNTRRLTLSSEDVKEISPDLESGKNVNPIFLYVEPSVSAIEMYNMWRLFKQHHVTFIGKRQIVR